MSRPVTFELASLRTVLCLMTGAAVLGAILALVSIYSSTPTLTPGEEQMQDSIRMLVGVFLLLAIGCGMGARILTRQLERLPVD